MEPESAFRNIESRIKREEDEIRNLKSRLNAIARGSQLVASLGGHGFLSAAHLDTTAAGPVRGDVIVAQGATPSWARLARSVPAANVRNVLGLDNGDTEPSWKTALDATNPAALGIANPGTSLVFSHRDHVHLDPVTAHVAAADPHTGYRLESDDHSHQSTGLQAGQLDHGLSLTGLTDDDHTQYTLKATLTTTGDLYYASAASTPARLGVSVPAANVRNVLGLDNGDTIPAWKTALDAVAPTTIVAADVAAAGTSLIFSHRDHRHGAPATYPPSAHVLDPSGAIHTGTLDADDVVFQKVGAPSYETLDDWFNQFGSAGLLNDITYVTNKDADEVTVAAGQGLLRMTNSPNGVLKFITWPAIDIVVSTTQNTAEYIGIDLDGGGAGIPGAVKHASFDWNWNTTFPLARIFHDGTNRHIFNASAHAEDTANKARRFLREVLPLSRTVGVEGGGLALSDGGALRFAMTAGKIWHGFSEFTIAEFTAGSTFTKWVRNSTGPTTWKAPTTGTTWPDDSFDNGTGVGTGLTVMTNNRWANLWWYVEAEDSDIAMLYGRAQYTSQMLAEAESPPNTTPGGLSEHGRLLGRFTFQKGAGTAALVASTNTAAFQASGVAAHGDLTGLSNDDHTQYALLAGRTGGQTLIGGIDAGNDLTLKSTAHATKGSIFLDELDGFLVNGYARIGSLTAPTNVTAGDLTAIRLSLGNTGAFGPGLGFFVDVQGTMTTTAAGAAVHTYIRNVIAPASNSSSEFRALLFQNLITATTGITLSTVTGGYFDNRFRQDGAVATVNGLTVVAAVVDSASPATVGTITALNGILFVYAGRASGTSVFTATTITGLNFQAGRLFSGVTITTLRDVFITNPTAPAALTTHIGIDIEELTRAATLNVGIRNASNMRQTGYLSVLGATTTPLNTTAGDVSVVRLLVGTDAAFPSNVQGYFNLPASGQVQVDINSVQKLLVASGAITVGVDGSAPRLTMTAMNGTNEGGEIVMNGAAANIDWTWDNNAGDLRWFESGNVRMLLAPTTHGLRVAGYLQLGSTAGPSLTTAGSLTMPGPLVATPSTVQTLAAGTALLANATVVQINSAGAVTSTATPFIADGQDGQILIIVNVDTADAFTVRDISSIASNLRLSGSVDYVIPAAGGTLTLVFNSTVGDWLEIGRGAN